MKTSIKIENLSKSFNGKRILKEINLELPEDGIFGILGKNGAGKTTLLATLMGLVTPTSGEIKIFNKCLRKDKFDILNEINFQSPYIEEPTILYIHRNPSKNLQDFRYTELNLHSYIQHLPKIQYLAHCHRQAAI